MQGISRGKNKVFVSDWFAVAANTEYAGIAHNLGTANAIFKILFSPDGGTTVHEMRVHNSSDGESYGGMIKNITSTTIKVQTMPNGVSVIWSVGSLAGQASGHYKIIGIA